MGGVKPARSKAFTLAEVLITLGIIGIVAAMTLPTLIQNYKKKTYVEGLKTSISIFSQGFRKTLADDSVDTVINTEMWKKCNYVDSGNSSDGRKACESILSQYFKVVKLQTYSDLRALGDTTDGFISNTTTCQNLVGKTNKWWFLNKKTQCIGESSGVTVTLSNGMKAYLRLNQYSSYIFMNYMDLDINGTKGPNTWGRDVFRLVILSNGDVVGYGDGQFAKAYAEYYRRDVDSERETFKNDAERDCSSSTTAPSYYCAGRIINDGWKMNY